VLRRSEHNPAIARIQDLTLISTLFNNGTYGGTSGTQGVDRPEESPNPFNEPPSGIDRPSVIGLSVGLTLGGVIFLALCVLCARLAWRRQRRRRIAASVPADLEENKAHYQLASHIQSPEPAIQVVKPVLSNEMLSTKMLSTIPIIKVKEPEARNRKRFLIMLCPLLDPTLYPCS
jgi:hypothetical protein